jgi:hypothetical protein
MNVDKSMYWLEISFNPEAYTIVKRNEQGRGILFEQENFVPFSGIMIDEESATFDKAWSCEDPKIREKWRDATKNLEDMKKQ